MSLEHGSVPATSLNIDSPLKVARCLQRGYATVYNGVYSYPDRRRMRVAQILVLPPFQRQGVGRALLQSVYALADAHDAPEVTVRACMLHVAA